MSNDETIRSQPTLMTVFTNPYHLIAFGFGAGLSPVAPGTVGTLVGVPIYWLLSFTPWPMYWAIVGLCLAIGVYVCSNSSRLLGVHDYQGIVWDEIVGFLIAMGAGPHEVLWVVIGFGLFRLFDIVKPWPIFTVDRRMQNGLGIMLDDVIAGIYALLTLQLFAYLWAVV